MRFLRERIRLTQKARKDVKREVESTAESITSALSAEDTAEVLDKIRSNTQRVFNTTRGLQRRKFEKLLRENKLLFLIQEHLMLTTLSGLLICHLGPLGTLRSPC